MISQKNDFFQVHLIDFYLMIISKQTGTVKTVPLIYYMLEYKFDLTKAS